MIFRAMTGTAVLLLSILTSFDSSADKLATGGDLVKVEVSNLIVNDQDRVVILVLKPEQSGAASQSADARRVLPLVIGFEEARSISAAFYRIAVPRPLSHDLMKKIVDGYGGSVASCVITKMERETFFAELHLKRADQEIVIDCRPSDAIGLAMRASAPVFVRRAVMDLHSVDPTRPEQSQKPPAT